MKILLAVDGSECSEAALKEVAMRPWPQGTEIEIFSAAEIPMLPPSDIGTLPAQYIDDIGKATREKAEEIVAEALAKINGHKQSGVTFTTKVVIDSPREAIIEESENWGADLIVVGSHGYRGYKRFLLGSVSSAVAAHAKCSVEIVRAHKHRAPA